MGRTARSMTVRVMCAKSRPLVMPRNCPDRRPGDARPDHQHHHRRPGGAHCDCLHQHKQQLRISRIILGILRH